MKAILVSALLLFGIQAHGDEKTSFVKTRVVAAAAEMVAFCIESDQRSVCDNASGLLESITPQAGLDYLWPSIRSIALMRLYCGAHAQQSLCDQADSLEKALASLLDTQKQQDAVAFSTQPIAVALLSGLNKKRRPGPPFTDWVGN